MGENLKKYLLWAGLLLISGSALADGWYRWLDKSGTVHYGDTPSPDAAHVEKQKVDSAPSADYADMPYETRRAQQNFPVTLYVIVVKGTSREDSSQIPLHTAMMVLLGSVAVRVEDYSQQAIQA